MLIEKGRKSRSPLAATDGIAIAAGLKQMRGKTVPQRQVAS